METYYQSQYQPSFTHDQEKLDEFNLDTLNTPDINPEFFTDTPNLFGKFLTSTSTVNPTLTQNSSLGKLAQIKDESDYGVFAELGNFPTSISTATNFDSRSYSPYPEIETKHLDSAAININSPESHHHLMMQPVSPNKVCPNLLSQSNGAATTYDDLSSTYPTSDYDSLPNSFENYCSPQTATSGSRHSSFSSGSDHSNQSEYNLLTDPSQILSLTASNPTTTAALIDPTYRVPQSPAGSVSSVYSHDSVGSAQSNKVFIELETLQQPNIQIKQEPIDMYEVLPTVIDDVYEYQTLMGGQTMAAPPQVNNQNYQTINTNDIYYQYQPVTISNAIGQQQQSTVATPTVTPATPTTNRKRNAQTAFSTPSTSASTSSHQSTSGATTTTTKKPRMTKREKQKLMEGDIGKFETENRELRNSINLLERQIAFCKRFLSENVAPVIQRQQQQQMQFVPSPPSGGSQQQQQLQQQPMLISVEGL